MENLVRQLETSALNEWIHSTSWLWPALEIAHFFGLSILMGALLVIDLRLCGQLRGIPPTVVRTLAPWAVAGFVINALSGSLLFAGDPGRYVINIGFQIKLLLIGIAGINALWFFLSVGPRFEAAVSRDGSLAAARIAGLVSLGTWLGVLLLGRLIPYIGTG